jgi:hypothetical protein
MTLEQYSRPAGNPPVKVDVQNSGRFHDFPADRYLFNHCGRPVFVAEVVYHVVIS